MHFWLQKEPLEVHMWSVCLSFPLCSKGEVRGEIEFDDMPCETIARWSTFPAFWEGMTAGGLLPRAGAGSGLGQGWFWLGEELV